MALELGDVKLRGDGAFQVISLHATPWPRRNFTRVEGLTALSVPPVNGST